MPETSNVTTRPAALTLDSVRAPARPATASGPLVSGAVDTRLQFRLATVRLINWYHFGEVVVPISGSTMLLGENGSGKSTILDAIQLALVADLTEVRFNKAANEHSDRNAYNYVRWRAR
jgi:uncharacterized protein YPO0396